MNRRKFLTGLAASSTLVLPGSAAFARAASQLGNPEDGSVAQELQFAQNHVHPASFNFPPTPVSLNETRENTDENVGEEVGMRLIIMYDTSGSVTNPAYQVEIEGIARALESEEFRNSVFFQGGPRSIALCIAEFDTVSRERIGWHRINNGEHDKLIALARRVRSLPRVTSAATHQVKALDFCANRLMKECPWPSEKSVIAFMTDGKDNNGNTNTAHERVVPAIDTLARDHEITVHSFSILHPWFPDLDEWCAEYFYTRPGYIKKNGQPLDDGFSVKVAEALGGPPLAYYDAAIQAFSRVVRVDIAQNNIPGSPAYRLA